MAEDIQTTETAIADAEPKTTARKAPARKPAAKPEVVESNVRKIAERAQEISRNPLLATLGFYGKAFDQLNEQFSALKEQVERRRGQATDLYAELLKRGEEVEAEARETFNNIKFPSLKELTDREALEARLEKARGRFAELKESVGFKTAA
jgi:hypothetical protein